MPTTLFPLKKPIYHREASHKKLLYLVQHHQDVSVDELLTEMERVEEDCDLTITNSAGNSLVGIAADNNDMDTLKVLLRHGAPHDIVHECVGLLPIVSARVNNNKEMVQLLENPQAYLAQFHSNPARDAQLE